MYCLSSNWLYCACKQSWIFHHNSVRNFDLLVSEDFYPNTSHSNYNIHRIDGIYTGIYFPPIEDWLPSSREGKDVNKSGPTYWGLTPFFTGGKGRQEIWSHLLKIDSLLQERGRTTNLVPPIGDWLNSSGKGEDDNKSGPTYWGLTPFFRGGLGRQQIWSHLLGIDSLLQGRGRTTTNLVICRRHRKTPRIGDWLPSSG